MKSTGEVIGIDEDYPRALYKAMLSAGYKIRNVDRVFVTLADRDKRAAFPLLRKLIFMGCMLFATRGTHEALHRAGIYSHLVRKIHEGSPNPADLIASGNVDLLINTVSQDEAMEQDALRIRRAAAENGIPCFTSLETARAMVEALSAENRGIRPTAVSLNQRLMALAEQRLPV
jgi:carbamoyl-phosphate synthase large subunit